MQSNSNLLTRMKYLKEIVIENRMPRMEDFCIGESRFYCHLDGGINGISADYPQ